MDNLNTRSPLWLDWDTVPLFFFYKDLVFGTGYIATVEVTGRVLCVREDEDEFSMIGVEPGGLVAVGGDKHEAHEAFRKTFTSVLFDIAAGVPSADHFIEEVQRFVHETSPSVLADWQSAVAEVRQRGNLDIEKVRNADAPVSVRVSISHELAPQQNTIDEPMHLVAA